MISTRARPKIKTYDKPILIPRSEGYSSLYRHVRCAICDQFAYCRIDQDIGSIVKVSYYCKRCIPNILL